MFKKIFALLAFASLINTQDKKYPFEVPPLEYEYNALEPYIDAVTMKLHHDAHHKAYVDNLNAALKDNKKLQKKTLDWLLKNLDKIRDTKTRMAIRNNGGGHWNHSFFWKTMHPKSDSIPKGKLLEALTDT